MTIFLTEDQAISYTVKRSARAKHGRLVVSSKDRVDVILPKRGMSIKDAHGWILKKRHWILSKQKELARRAGLFDMEESIVKDIRDRQQCFYQGALRPFCIIEDRVAKIEFYYDEARGFTILIPYGALHLPFIYSRILTAFHQWLEETLLTHARYIIESEGLDYNLKPTHVSIRQQKTLWGSCSSNGSIRLNLALVLTSYEAMHYVIIHELCHLRYPNHSALFWKLVKEILPNYQQAKHWLKEHHFLCSYINDLPK